jgi:hypothetical protein
MKIRNFMAFDCIIIDAKEREKLQIPQLRFGFSIKQCRGDATPVKSEGHVSPLK